MARKEIINYDYELLINLFIKLFICCICSFYINKSDNIMTTLQRTFTFIGGPYLTGNLLSTPITDFTKKLSLFFPSFLRANKEKTKQDYLKIIKNNKDKFDENVLDTLADCFLKCRTHELYEMNITTCIKFIVDLHVFDEAPHITLDDKLLDSFDNFLKTYDNKDSLKNDMIIPLLSSIYGGNKMPPIMLIGKPGTGKTSFIEKIAQILDLDIIRCNVHELSYFNESFLMHDFYSKLHLKKLNIISNALNHSIMTKKKKKFILLFDEIDKTISDDDNPRNTMLHLFELFNNSAIYDRYIDISIDSSCALIFCTANSYIGDVNPKLKPLQNRLTHFVFPNISKETKKDIMKKYIKQNTKDYDNDIYDKFIDTFLEHDKEAGVRLLINYTNIFINSVTSVQFFNSTKWAKDISFDSLLKKFIDEQNINEQNSSQIIKED